MVLLRIAAEELSAPLLLGLLAGAILLGVSCGRLLDAPLLAWLHAPGADFARALELEDYIIDFEITPNRPDCLSMVGMAREAAATFKEKASTTWPTIEEEIGSERYNAIIDEVNRISEDLGV